MNNLEVTKPGKLERSKGGWLDATTHGSKAKNTKRFIKTNSKGCKGAWLDATTHGSKAKNTKSFVKTDSKGCKGGWLYFLSYKWLYFPLANIQVRKLSPVWCLIIAISEHW